MAKITPSHITQLLRLLFTIWMVNVLHSVNKGLFLPTNKPKRVESIFLSYILSLQNFVTNSGVSHFHLVTKPIQRFQTKILFLEIVSWFISYNIPIIKMKMVFTFFSKPQKQDPLTNIEN